MFIFAVSGFATAENEPDAHMKRNNWICAFVFVQHVRHVVHMLVSSLRTCGICAHVCVFSAHMSVCSLRTCVCVFFAHISVSSLRTCKDTEDTQQRRHFFVAWKLVSKCCVYTLSCVIDFFFITIGTTEHLCI
eukprot:GHVS01013785.1.p1 GENE.GHVS01013785.1~~GHVS01013785.1.p1  ORF type:complete len:133 (+),score=16.44 GHVS01013785.1:72-470(+)